MTCFQGSVALLACSLLGAALGLVGCSSTGVGNPGVISLAVVADESDASGASAGAGGDSAALGNAGAAGATESAEPPLPAASIQHAFLVLGELRFLPCDPAVGETTVLPGPFVVDLKSGTTNPEIPAISNTEGGYCGLDAPLAPARSPAALAGRSVFFDGTRADGAFFLVYANVSATLRLRARAGVSWHGKKTPLVFWALRPRRWLLPGELNTAEAAPFDGHPRAIVVDANLHPNLFLLLRSRLAGASALYADTNHDGQFDDADRAIVLGEGLDNAD